jgi:hypothetical protein
LQRDNILSDDDSSVVAQDVDLTKGRNRLLGRTSAIFARSHIAGQCQSFPAILGNRIGRYYRCLLILVKNSDCTTHFGQASHNAPPDSRRSSRHDRDSALE